MSSSRSWMGDSNQVERDGGGGGGASRYGGGGGGRGGRFTTWRDGRGGGGGGGGGGRHQQQQRYGGSGYGSGYSRSEYSLFVGDLSEDVDDQTLLAGFSQWYPSCIAAKVITDYNGRSKGFGFVRFSCSEEQQRALSEMQYAQGIGQNAIKVNTATRRQ